MKREEARRSWEGLRERVERSADSPSEDQDEPRARIIMSAEAAR